MANLSVHFRKFCLKKREGISMIECIILIMVVAFTVGAMLQTSVITSKMQIIGRQYIDSHKSMVSFFHTLESIDPEQIVAHDNVGDILNAVQDINPAGNFIYIIKPEVISSADGVLTVGITLTDSMILNDPQKQKKIVLKNFNIFSNKTVSDDRSKIVNE